MNRTKKSLLGCSVLVVLVVLGIATVTTVDWSGIRSASEEGAGDEELALGLELSKEFGDQPSVEFVCRLPVVDAAPCALLASGRGSREVRLTFSDYEVPAAVAPEALARRIALAAHQASTFAEGSDKTEVIFEEGDESASVVRKFSFAARELAADRAADGE